mmetsp:Transcript_12908/g.47797  ORF Transcript_12908/g.47797 Transcript_12908/m.47797 type:complete len:311 (+) Transcript_12908:264-1196(+)
MSNTTASQKALAAVAFASAAAVLLYAVRTRRKRRSGPPRILSCPVLSALPGYLSRKKRRVNSAPAPSGVPPCVSRDLVHFYLIRHGQSTWNRAGRIQGQLDLPLAPKGVVEAELLATSLRDRRIDAVVASPLSRALDTARAVVKRHANKNLEVHEDWRLAERHFGTLQGAYKTDPEFTEFLQAQKQHAVAGFATYAAPGEDGESLADVQVRATSALEDIAEDEADFEYVLVFTHSNLIKALCWELSGLSWERLEKLFPVHNCSSTEIIYDRTMGSWSVGAMFEQLIPIVNVKAADLPQRPEYVRVAVAAN